jgi:hypothetical protein
MFTIFIVTVSRNKIDTQSKAPVSVPFGIRDPESGKNSSQIQGDPGSWSATLLGSETIFLESGFELSKSFLFRSYLSKKCYRR